MKSRKTKATKVEQFFILQNGDESGRDDALGNPILSWPGKSKYFSYEAAETTARLICAKNGSTIYITGVVAKVEVAPSATPVKITKV